MSTIIKEEGVNPNLDYIFQRGRVAFKFSGTYKYRDIVEANVQTYTSANNSAKRHIIHSIVAIVANAGGRYLQQIKTDGKTLYKVLGYELAIQKTSQALRDRKAEKKKRSEGAAASLLALANAQPNTAATTNTLPSQALPSLSIDADTRV